MLQAHNVQDADRQTGIRFCDNQLIVQNSTICESKLKKERISITYHKVRANVDAKILIVFSIRMKKKIWQIKSLKIYLPKHDKK